MRKHETNKPEEEQVLLLQMAKGEEKAFREMYERYRKRVFLLAFTYLQQESDALEITQQVFILLWEKREGLNQVQKPADYIFTITRNCIMDYYRQLGRQAKLVAGIRDKTPVDGNDAGARIAEKTIMGIWHRQISRLPAQRRTIYEMVEMQGYSLDEVAGMLQLSKATVKKHLELARRFIRIEVQQQLQADDTATGNSGRYLFFLLFY